MKKLLIKLGFSTPNKLEFQRYYKQLQFCRDLRLSIYIIEESNRIEMYLSRNSRILERKYKQYRKALDEEKIFVELNSFVDLVNEKYKTYFNRFNYGHIADTISRSSGVSNLED